MTSSDPDLSTDLTWYPQSDELLSTEDLAPGWQNELMKERERLLCLSSPSYAQHILQGYLIKSISRPDSWCQTSKMVANKVGGYVQVSSAGANKFCTLGDLLLWTTGRSTAAGEQASHLCHEPLCLLAEHVVVESEELNQRRKNCVVWVDCAHSRECPLKVLVCPHHPTCIKFCSGYSSQDKFIANGIHG